MRKVIKASEGHILTNGEVYGTKIYLAEGVNADDYHEITLEEYNNLMEAESEIEEDAEILAAENITAEWE